MASESAGMELRVPNAPSLVLMTAGVMLTILNDLSRLSRSWAADDPDMCPQGEFFSVQNQTCLPCPATCSKCLPRVTHPDSPCLSCSGDTALRLTETERESRDYRDRWTVGGDCLNCKDNDLLISTGPSNIRLNLVGTTQEEASQYILEGRLEVSFGGQWGAVCDDGWAMENVDVICKELSFGIGLGYDKQYDILHSYLPPLNIIMDNVHCSGKEKSLFECDFVGQHQENCESGETTGIRCSGPMLQGPYCRSHCPFSQIPDGDLSRCIDCTPPCLACRKAPTYCTVCEPPLFLNEGGLCLLSCPSGLYGNSNERTCLPCSSLCRTCMNGARAGVCTSCASGLLLFNHACVEECPNTTVFHWNGNAVCVEECPEGFYTSNGMCRKCSDACGTCQSHRDNCTRCKHTFVLQPSPNPSMILGNYTITYSCQETCREGYYANYKNACFPCQDKHCARCHLGGEFCKICKSGFLWQLGVCVMTCDNGLFDVDGGCAFPCSEGYYGNKETKLCEACGASCRLCLEPGVCTSCYANHYLKNDTCEKDCGDRYISMSFPARSDVRLLGGQGPLEGRVEVYVKGVWKSVCTEEWTLRTANLVCRELQLGKALSISTDMRFGHGNLALVVRLHCQPNATSLAECFQQGPDCTSGGAGLYCSGPSLGSVKECHVTNSQSCDQRPCAEGVECWGLPGGTEGGEVSRCGLCPRGTRGNGKVCEVTDKTKGSVRILFPATPVTLNNWPEGVQLTLPVITSTVTGQHVYTWFKDGRKLKTNADYRIEQSGSLTIFVPVGQKASGKYSCVVSTTAGNASTFYQLSFLESIHIRSPPKSHVAGQRGVILICSSEGFPKPSITWRKDGEPLDFGSFGGRARTNRQGTLIIRDVRGTDSGLYTCTAHNKYTMATASANVTIRATPHILNKQPFTMAISGTLLQLNCEVTGGPTPRVYWKLNNDDIEDSPHIQSLLNGTLVIWPVREEDAGLYRCVALNEVGPPDVWVTNVTVFAAPTAAVTPPEVATSVGGKLVLRCEAEGKPTPNITWLTPARGRLFQTDPHAKVEVINGEGTSVLTLFSAHDNDTGVVSCIARNDAGEDAARSRLVVRVAPYWTRAPSARWLLAGWPVTLTWSASARPLASYVWFRDGLELRDGSRYHIKDGVLSWTPDHPYDSGTYSLQASNSEGTVVGSGHLEVVANFSVPKVKYAELTNVTLNMLDIPSQITDINFEIIVVRLSINGTRENISTSPLDLGTVSPVQQARMKKADTTKGHVTILYDRLPRHVTIGDGKRYASIRSKTSVVNAPLVGGEWYAIAVRLIRHQRAVASTELHWSPARHPVGATHYAYVFTRQTEKAKGIGSGHAWQVALAAVFGLLLCLVPVVGCFLFFYWRHHGHLPLEGLSKLLWHRRRQKGQLEGSTSSPIDVDRYLSQFNPDPDPSRGRSSRDGAAGSSSETVSTSVSTLYIPTEDEIDSLESIGIHYYEDDNWISRVPSGVLSISRARLDLLRREGSHASSANSSRPSTSEDKYARASTSSDTEGTSMVQRTNSDPSMAAVGPQTLPSPLLERTNSEPVVSVPTKKSKPDHHKGIANKAFHEGRRSNHTKETNTLKKEPNKGSPVKNPGVHKTVGKTLSKDSKQSDSGFESGHHRHPVRSSKAVSHRRKPPTGHAPRQTGQPRSSAKRSKAGSGGERKHTYTSPKQVRTRQKSSHKDRKRKPRGRRFSNWRDKNLKTLRDKGISLLSRGRQWARNVLDRHDAYGLHESDSDSTSDNRGSGIEMGQIRENPVGQDGDDIDQSPQRSSTQLHQERPIVDLDGEYIDPSSIMSIPDRKILSSNSNEDRHLTVSDKDSPDREIIIEDLSGEPRTEMTSFMADESITISLDEASVSDDPDDVTSVEIYQSSVGETSETVSTLLLEKNKGHDETGQMAQKDEESQTDEYLSIKEDRNINGNGMVPVLTTIEEDSSSDVDITGERVSINTDKQDPEQITADLVIPDVVTPNRCQHSPSLKSTDSYVSLLNVCDKEERDCTVCNEVHERVLAGPAQASEREITSLGAVPGKVGQGPGEAPLVPPRPSETISHSYTDERGSNEYISLIDTIRGDSGPEQEAATEGQVAASVATDDLYQPLSPQEGQDDHSLDVLLACPLRLTHKDSLLLPRNSSLRIFPYNGSEGDAHNDGSADTETVECQSETLKDLPGGEKEFHTPAKHNTDAMEYKGSEQEAQRSLMVSASEAEDGGKQPQQYIADIHTDISSVLKTPKPNRLVIPDVFQTR